MQVLTANWLIESISMISIENLSLNFQQREYIWYMDISPLDLQYFFF